MNKNLLWMGVPVLWCSVAGAASTSTVVPVTAVTQSACQFSMANGFPEIVLPDYGASTPTAETGQVDISVYCNNGTVLTARKVGGISTATTRATAITVPLTRNGVVGATAVNALVWVTAKSSNTVPSGVFQGASRHVSALFAGWPATPQFGAPTGFYSGTVDFAVDF